MAVNKGPAFRVYPLTGIRNNFILKSSSNLFCCCYLLIAKILSLRKEFLQANREN
jgi:hypothetical protein